MTSLLKTVTDAAEIVARMAAMMLSTARSSFDEFQNARQCGEMLFDLLKSISWGQNHVNPNGCGKLIAL